MYLSKFCSARTKVIINTIIIIILAYLSSHCLHPFNIFCYHTTFSVSSLLLSSPFHWRLHFIISCLLLLPACYFLHLSTIFSLWLYSSFHCCLPVTVWSILLSPLFQYLLPFIVLFLSSFPRFYCLLAFIIFSHFFLKHFIISYFFLSPFLYPSSFHYLLLLIVCSLQFYP